MAEIRGRIVINPAILTDDRDALAVAYNEAYRAVMEAYGFEPKADPTPEQEEFFSDTAYATDPLMMRRTITARVATYDTSVPNPTPDQYRDAADMLRMVQSAGVISNSQEESIVSSTLADMERLAEETQLEPLTPPAEAPAEMPAEPPVDQLYPQGAEVLDQLQEAPAAPEAAMPEGEAPAEVLGVTPDGIPPEALEQLMPGGQDMPTGEQGTPPVEQ